MTFEEWFTNTFPEDDKDVVSNIIIKEIARAAWEAGYADGVEAMGGPVVHVENPNSGLPGTTDYTYEDFSRDSDR